MTGTFTFVAPLRLLRFDAFNGGTSAASITVSCPANPEQPVKQASVPAGHLTTIATGWSGTCSSVSLSSSNGWETNFDNLVLDAPQDTTAPVISAVAASVTQATATITWTTNEAADRQVQVRPHVGLRLGLADWYAAKHQSFGDGDRAERQHAVSLSRRQP